MALQAQRFAGDPILEACLAGSHRMGFGDPNAASVLKVQMALSDLGYRPMLLDGKFGEITGAAVTTFKTDQALSPSPDHVVGPGTMGALDSFYAAESSTPDSPDPSADGLEQVVADVTADHVLPWFDAASAVLARFPTDEAFPSDPDWVAFDSAMERNFHTSLLPLGRAYG